jgi:hypothetical protein
MVYVNKALVSRIEWCRKQSTQARAPRERAEWHAEGEGLRDALLNHNHTYQYLQGPLGVFDRYVMGLWYGREVLRTAAGYAQFAIPTRTAWTCDVSMRRIMGLTRRGETNGHECRITGDQNKIMGRVARHGVLPRSTEKNYQVKN